MMVADLPGLLLRVNLAIGAAILLVLVLRGPVRALLGARAAYGLWLIAPLAALAVLLPARTVVITAPAPPPARAVATVEPSSATLTAAPVNSGAINDLKAVSRPYRPRDILVGAWALVALMALAVQAERQRRFLKSLGRLRRDDGLFHAQHAGVGPAVIGALHPRIVLPADFALRFTAREQALILAHEQSHLSSGDAQINALTAVIQCLFWFNPLVHVGAHRLRIDQEIACDAAVVSRFPVDRRAYGEAMLKTQLAPRAPPIGCHWPACATQQLKERFVMLQHHNHGRARRLAGAAAVTVLALGAGVAAWAAQPAKLVQAPLSVAGHDVRRDRINPLFQAVRQGDADKVRALIAGGADVNARVSGDGTALIEAARSGQVDMVNLLLDSGADPRLASRGDGAPLLAAASGGQLAITKALVERGAPVNDGARGDGTPLINAIRSGDPATVAYLLDKGADVNRVAPGDGSPLMEATRAGQSDVVTLLLTKGADANLAVRGDGNPLIVAAGSGRLDLVKMLVAHGAAVESFVYGDETPLINAAQSGDLATVRYLVERGADVNRAVPSNPGQTRSPLGEAIRKGHPAIIDYLKAQGARS